MYMYVCAYMYMMAHCVTLEIDCGVRYGRDVAMLTDLVNIQPSALNLDPKT